MSLVLSQKHLQLIVNGLLASANGALGRFENYDEMVSASMYKCPFTEIIILTLLTGSMSYSSKKAGKVYNMKILFSSNFFAKAGVSFVMTGSFQTN